MANELKISVTLGSDLYEAFLQASDMLALGYSAQGAK